MSKEDLLDRIMAALGPRKVEAVGIGIAGVGHATKRDEICAERVANNETPLYGVIWVSEEQFELSKKNNFVWYIDMMPVHEGKLVDRPPEIQKLPAQICVYSHDPHLLFDEELGKLFSHLSYEERFKTAQKWHHPGTYEKKTGK